MNVLVFDIETVIDINGARRVHDLHGLTDDDVAKAVLHLQRQQHHSEQLPNYLQQVIAISAVLVTEQRFNVWSLGSEDSDEADLLQRFFDGIKKYQPQLVSWNGNQTILPVLHDRSMLYPINADTYWKADSAGQLPTSANAQVAQYPWHVDMKQVMQGSDSQQATNLQDFAALCGLVNSQQQKQLLDNWALWVEGEIEPIRHACEHRVLEIYLLYLRWERNRGNISDDHFNQQCGMIRQELKQSSQPHLVTFEQHWIDL